MQHDILPNAEQYKRKHLRHKVWIRLVSMLACVVVFCTTYALILPAITLESDSFCGKKEHEHTQECYVQVIDKSKESEVSAPQAEKQLTCMVHTHTAACQDSSGSLICGLEGQLVHAHTQECYEVKSVLSCQQPETEVHIHADACYLTIPAETHAHADACYTTEKGSLICTQTESSGHAHGEGCYTTQKGALLCTQPESSGHVHTEGCCDETGNVVCGQEEYDGHSHGDGCYAWDSVLSCGQEEYAGHTHEDACYAWNQVLICGQEENLDATAETELICSETINIVHTHTEECYETNEQLVCELPEVSEHVHTEACYTIVDIPAETDAPVQETEALTCTKDHKHKAMCYGTWKMICEKEEHEHELICYSDKNADLESASIWEKTLANVKLTGDWADDVISVAESQLGYAESIRNYIVNDEGKKKGYNRYGAWYGDPYGDWCAMFVSFCLNYADIPRSDFPYEASCHRWVQELSSRGMYADKEHYVPKPGDIILFDNDQDGISEHVGIVAELIAAETDPAAKIKTIEGNTSGGHVANITYSRNDSGIMGYGIMPETESESEIESEFESESEIENEFESESEIESEFESESEIESEFESESEIESEFESESEIESEFESESEIESEFESESEIESESESESETDSDDLEVSAAKDAASYITGIRYEDSDGYEVLQYMSDMKFRMVIDLAIPAAEEESEAVEELSSESDTSLRTYKVMLAEYFTELVCENAEADGNTLTFTVDETAANVQLAVTGTIFYDGMEDLEINPVVGCTEAWVRIAVPMRMMVRAAGTFHYQDDELTATVNVTNSGNANLSNARFVMNAISEDDPVYKNMLARHEYTGLNRTLDHRIYNFAFVDANGRMINLDNVSFDLNIKWNTDFAKIDQDGITFETHFGNNESYKEFKNVLVDNTKNEVNIEFQSIAVRNNNWAVLEFFTTDGKAREMNGKLTLKYNTMRDAFIYDPAYAQFYNANSPIGTAGSFHIVAFESASLGTHTNGNILAKNLYGNGHAFGTNSKNGVDLIEISYAQKYSNVSGNSSANTTDYLAVGSETNLTVFSNNNDPYFAIDNQKLSNPYNMIQDEDTAKRPFIDLVRVENEVKSIAANLASYETSSEDILKVTSNSLTLADPDNVGVYNTTASEISQKTNLTMYGFQTGHTGAIVVNVDCAGWSGDLKIPVARVWVDGKQVNIDETLDFSAGKVIWNFINAEGITIYTSEMTGMVLAPESHIEIPTNINGTVVGNTVHNTGESHRTDFTGKIVPTERVDGAHINLFKINKGNFGQLLEGAKFALYEWNGSEYVPADQTNDENIKITDQNGRILFEHLKYNVAYKLVEVEAPEGYVLSTDELYFYFEDTSSNPAPELKPADFKESTGVDAFTHYYPNEESDVSTTSIKVDKRWVNQDGTVLESDEVLWDSIKFQIWRAVRPAVTDTNGNLVYENDEIKYGEPGEWEPYRTYTLSSEEGWTKTVNNLPLTSQHLDCKYEYTVKEVAGEGYTGTVTKNSDGSYVITNTLTEDIEYAPLRVRKAWNLNEGSQLPAGTAVTIDIYQVSRTSEKEAWSNPGELVKTIQLSAENDWSWTSAAEEFPAAVTHGNTTVYYAYYAVESDIPDGFYPGYGDISKENPVNGSDWTITVTNNEFAETEVKVEKKWYLSTSDTEGFTANSGSVTVQLYQVFSKEQNTDSSNADAVIYGESVTLSTANNWKHTFSDLPLYTYDAAGEITGYYSYYVAETEGEKYSVKYEYLGADGEEIESAQSIPSGTIVVKNYVQDDAYTLPETGGTGTDMYTMGGLLLIAVSILLMYKEKRRRKEEVASS